MVETLEDSAADIGVTHCKADIDIALCLRAVHESGELWQGTAPGEIFCLSMA